ncbi:MAG: biopolymer transporter ExbD [Phycisphaerales bacterium]|jgi:biopolymer transport protein ExbD
MGLKRSQRSAKRSSHLGVLPLTSMIDVVFLLLVYFLVTSSFAQPERDLPSSVQTDGGGVRSSELQPQIVVIELQGGEAVYRVGSNRVLTQDGLTQLLRSLPKEPGIAVKAQRDVPIRFIAVAMQASQDAGFTRRSYVPTGR